MCAYTHTHTHTHTHLQHAHTNTYTHNYAHKHTHNISGQNKSTIGHFTTNFSIWLTKIWPHFLNIFNGTSV